jgi:hypothetical protein
MKVKSLIVLIVLLVFPLGAIADTAEEEAKPKATGDNADNTELIEVSPSLKGKVTGTHLLDRDILGRIGSTSESIKKTCLVVLNELAMPEAVVGTSPNVVGATVLPALPVPSGVAYLGHEEPHPLAAAKAINSVLDYAKRLEDEISSTVVPAEAAGYAKELWDKLHEVSEKLYADLNDLVRLARSKGAIYETTKMEKLALRVYDKSEAINRLRRRIADELK